ncbi:zinc ABC transporter solute-binding protein [Aristophania vespae]|uniref:Zinc ABC transporter solute-binding protein n=1 Tax=Aristophania vespae TaxID=2697033 RepID=A0A6P1NI88_9PROT|nr:zinc ABC transporter substrate-binding protein [Aristophania vespae]QHI96244.1 zinc ABC transporter solute-binding protein [Aristophania vespae]UMM64046.1 Manganese ABC transporter substrate-binding lipoprotein [Aristophania vespae]
MRFLRRASKYFFFIFCSFCSVSGGFHTEHARAASLSLLCVETVWCDVAQQIGGSNLKTKALLTAPGIDPHHFQPSPSLIRSVKQADGFLANGATYDDWALAFRHADSNRFVASEIGKWRNGEDPHLFFQPEIIHSVARVIAVWLEQRDPQNQKIYKDHLAKFEQSLDDLDKKISLFKERYKDIPIAITEPAGERLLSKTGLKIIDQRWALSVMNQTGVSAQETALLERALTQHNIAVLVVNPLVASAQINNLVSIAKKHHIPIITIGETLPAGQTWQGWMNHILDQLASALDKKELQR